MIKAFHHIYTTEGMSTFFNGWKYAIKQATVSNICYFLLYERLKILLENNLASGRYTFVPFLSAAVARTLTTTGI
jgi:solute carrier family 25 protein 39/40